MKQSLDGDKPIIDEGPYFEETGKLFPPGVTTREEAEAKTCGHAGCDKEATHVISGKEFGMFDLGPMGTLLCGKCAHDAELVGFPVEKIKETK